MKELKIFTPRPRKKVLISNDFREILLSHETTIIEQRIIVIILSAIRDEQSLFIKVRSPLDTKNETQLSFDDYFGDWTNQRTVDFSLPFEELNPYKKMKNASIQAALINMGNMNWLRLRDEKINGYKAVPFIIEPEWNHKNINFKMDKTVMKHLVNMNPYFPVTKDLPYQVSTSNSLRFLMWLLKYKNQDRIIKSYPQILKELFISQDQYEGHYRFERDFLVNVKADLDTYNELSFNYSYSKGYYSISIYYTRNAVEWKTEFPTLDTLQTERALKYLKKRRGLTSHNTSVLKRLFEVKGYKILSIHLKRKIPVNLKGDEYVKAVFQLLENT
ncbi:hypothetical protein [Elizabethkingia sp. M8]|uniref:hypothetical protein n=1 Tax=Elizabethkingia sp. M8 TaxID=2796140 RepID=UPI001904FFB5|nr:hypothetical protein [Elizabethkingia sp. M8]QQM25349.1 hypothetical protein JCR23_10575 [Elizabethkingia sp. M8]